MFTADNVERKIRLAIQTRNQFALDRVAMACGANGWPFETVAEEVMKEMPEAVRHWWLGEACPCLSARHN